MGRRPGADGTRTMRNLDAAFVYARLDDSLADAAIRKLAAETIVRRADDAVKLSKGSAFGFTTAGRSLSWGALTVPADTALVRAYVLTGKPEYLETILRSALYSAGANPLNMTMTTGLGHDWPRHLLHEDSRHFGQPVPVGITIYGPSDPVAGQNDNNGWGIQKASNRVHAPGAGVADNGSVLRCLSMGRTERVHGLPDHGTHVVRVGLPGGALRHYDSHERRCRTLRRVGNHRVACD